AVIDGQPRGRLPRVLAVPLRPPLPVVRVAVAIRLGVLRVDAEDRVRVREVRVERVAGVVVELELAHPRPASRLVVLHVLEVAANLDGVRTVRPREVVTHTGEPVERRGSDAVVEREVRGVDSGRAEAEGQRGDQAERIERRVELAQRVTDIAPANTLPVAV